MTAIRETWLNKMTARLAPDFERVGAPLPGKVRVSCGWPSTGKGGRAIGECWSPKASADERHEIFISPKISDGIEAGAILVHELVHAALGTDAGHGPKFAKVAKALGLEGKMTATVAGEELRERLNALVQEIGDYPHAALAALAAPRKKQTTRMIKVTCPECGYTIRTTKQWLEVGTPTCPCGTKMEAPDAEDGDEE